VTDMAVATLSGWALLAFFGSFPLPFLLLVTVYADSRRRRAQSKALALLLLEAASAATLAASWGCTFVLVGLRSDWMLVPWDMWGELRPPPGTWERELNDFFNHGGNVYLPALALLGLDVTLFALRMLRAGDWRRRSWLIVAFAQANAAFLLIGFVAVFALGDIASLWLPPAPPAAGVGYSAPDIGYHRTWPSIASYLMLSGALIYTHVTVRVPGFWQCLHRHASEGERRGRAQPG